MNADQIKNEFTETGNRKTMLGVRLFHELKYNLTEEAKEIGITLSEHCESILANKDALLAEKLSIIHELEQNKKAAVFLSESLNKAKEQYKSELLSAQTEISQLKKQVEEMKPQLALFKNERLLFLFNKLKGKKDSIKISDDKSYNITYEHPKDLLEAMIHSFTIK